MSEIFLSSSSDSVDKAIDEYTDCSSFSGSSDSNSSSGGSSSEGNTSNEYVWCSWGSFRGSPRRAQNEV